MATDIHKIIAAISPDVYCKSDFTEDDSGKRVERRKLVKKIVEEEGYLAAAKTAEQVDSSFYLDIIQTRFTKNIFSYPGIKNPIERHELSYDASSQSLEPTYFWILDFLHTQFGQTEKLVDNFTSSAASGFFAEMQGRATKMQEEAMKMLGTVNTVLRSVLNIIYDLKEFKMRLSTYDDYNSSDKKIKNAALLGLKQIWMDSVDIKRGNTSLKAMSQQFDYVTLIDAFMSASSLDDVTKKPEEGGFDLNERVKRILEQRLADFFKWIDQSEKELRKRFEIEKIYLKSQINSLKLYARWIKPYLKAASQLEQRTSQTSAIVTSFNTALFELTVLAKSKYDPLGDIQNGDLPEHFKYLKLRKYSPIIIVEFKFRSVPERGDQRGGYGFRGRVDIVFTSYSLNDDEIKVLKEQIEKDDISDLYSLIEGSTEESLGQLKEDIDEFLSDAPVKKDNKQASEDSNPFSSLFSFFKSDDSKEKNKKKDFSKGIPPDSMDEKALRSQASLDARWGCRKLYNSLKGSMEMPGMPPVM